MGARFSSWAIPAGNPALTRGRVESRAGARQFFRALDARRPHTTGNRGFATTDCRGMGGQRRVTPGRACPRPNGFGRNLRSKTRWFTGFCNSHQVSHFATFFIDARAEISVAESRFDIFEDDDAARAHRFRGDGDALSRSSSLAQFAPVFVCTPGRGRPRERSATPRDKGTRSTPRRPLAPRFETSSR
ncbi:unnamed protein product, partial [Prunus brigantina]